VPHDGDPETGTDIITEDCLCGGSIDTDGGTDEGPGIIGAGESGEQIAERFVRTGNFSGLVPNVNVVGANLSAFPNPLVGSSLNVLLPETMTNAEVRLLSLTGREITRSANVTTGFSLDVPVLEAGVYLLEAVSGTDRNVTRIVVQ